MDHLFYMLEALRLELRALSEPHTETKQRLRLQADFMVEQIWEVAAARQEIIRGRPRPLRGPTAKPQTTSA